MNDGDIFAFVNSLDDYIIEASKDTGVVFSVERHNARNKLINTMLGLFRESTRAKKDCGNPALDALKKVTKECDNLIEKFYNGKTEKEDHDRAEDAIDNARKIIEESEREK